MQIVTENDIICTKKEGVKIITIDDSYKLLPDKLRGRKPKVKLRKDNKEYIFKYGSINSEIWAELIAEQLGIQVGIDMAHYEIASYKNTIGLLTNSFIKPGELIISSDYLKKGIQAILSENNITANLKNNSLENIIQAVFTYDNSIDSPKLYFELTKRWAFYGLIMESDKNETNISFINSLSSGLKLSPDYDNSSMAGLNNNINQNIQSLKAGYSIYHFTDDIKSNLHRTENDTGNFLIDFKTFSEKHQKDCEKILEEFELINPDEAMDKVEEINNVTIPWEVRFWVNSTISQRHQDMKSIFEQSKAKTQIKQ